ncbi:prenyltransferase/squalene oxidase repeat-containing protein [Streptomyces xiaopingdaonensis]|uniref:prenyltransferase/squalene oxidase repeat-containing protein n=1 Tax=Streptomyces xiaopingdaonensis TaxID=1565415 RepID=UPI00035EDE07
MVLGFSESALPLGRRRWARRTAAFAVAALGLGALAPAASAEDSKPKAPAALYGAGDPTYDGVWRQSLALLAQLGAGAEPAAKAVTFLADQQCDDGYFTSYRPRPDESCDPKETPGDTNATALAVQALAAVGGQRAGVDRAVEWLRSEQNDDGGWGYEAGSPTDANSTALVVGALRAAGVKPASVREGDEAPQDALASLQLGCDAPQEERGAFAYQPEKKGGLTPNTAATTAAVLGAYGKGVLVEPAAEGAEPAALDCADGGGHTAQQRAEAGAAWLVAELQRNGGYLKSSLPGQDDQPDYTGTADAALALAAGGHGEAAQQPLGWLRKNLKEWKKSTTDPAAIGTALLASRSAGGDPAKLGTATLDRLNATGPAPSPAAEDEEDDSGNSTVWTWSLVLVGLAVGGAIGLVLSTRRKK